MAAYIGPLLVYVCFRTVQHLLNQGKKMTLNKPKNVAMAS